MDFTALVYMVAMGGGGAFRAWADDRQDTASRYTLFDVGVTAAAGGLVPSLLPLWAWTAPLGNLHPVPMALLMFVLGACVSLAIFEAVRLKAPALIARLATRAETKIGMAVLAVLLLPTVVSAQRISGGTSIPSSTTIQLGSSTSTGTTCAVANVNTTSVGNSGVAETDLMTYSLPANALATNGSFVRIRAWGTAAANGNTKTIKFYFGATAVKTAGPSAGFNNVVFDATITVVRTSATAQEAIATQTIGNGTQDPGSEHTTPAETLTGAVTIKVTGTSGTASNDVVQTGMTVEVCNR